MILKINDENVSMTQIYDCPLKNDLTKKNFLTISIIRILFFFNII